MDAVRARLDEFGSATVLAVTFSDPEQLPEYQRRFAAPLTVVSDRERALYRQLELGRGSWWRIWGLRAARSYAHLLRKGHRLTAITEDTLQLGGDVITDDRGEVVWSRKAEGPDDRPSVDEILSALHRVRDEAR